MTNKMHRLYRCACGFSCPDITDLSRHRSKLKPCTNTVDGKFDLKPEILYDLVSSKGLSIAVNANIVVYPLGSPEELNFYYRKSVDELKDLLVAPLLTTLCGHYIKSVYCNPEVPHFWCVRKKSKRCDSTMLTKTQIGYKEITEFEFIRHVMYNIGKVLQELYGRRADYRVPINAYESFLNANNFPNISSTLDISFTRYPAFKPDMDKSLLRNTIATHRAMMNDDQTRSIKAQPSLGTLLF